MGWMNAEVWRWSLTAAYLLLLSLIALYGLHRYWLVYLFRRHLHERPRPRHRYRRLPAVTVQLPMYNEGRVAERIIDAACELNYPADRLEIQVLDDSTDGSEARVRRRVNHWRERGVAIEHLHRADRTGYKAGALAAGLKRARGELIAIFDADFVPPPRFLRRSVHYFTEADLGMVQARWSHLNRGHSLLTRGQAIFLDGHFLIEHAARNRSGAWMNFNGTAGVWRRRAIEQAGGWQHDTLTEDMDLSYRAQLAGWKFLFLPRLACPAELPPEIHAFKSQQHRWTKGSIQTARKLLPRVLRSRWPMRVKVEAFFHLTSPMVYLYVTLLALMFYPTLFINSQALGGDTPLGVLVGLTLFGLGTASGAAFYLVSQTALHRGFWKTLTQVPLLMAIGIGIAVNNARACVEALVGHPSPFVRTPKYNVTEKTRPLRPTTGRRRECSKAAESDRNKSVLSIPPLRKMAWSVGLVELAMGIYIADCIRLSWQFHGSLVGLPFLMLFAAGYFYVGTTSLWRSLRYG